MPFVLQEEIVRLSNADDYQLFILQKHIERILNTPTKLQKLRAKISLGTLLTYFDSELLKEDLILVTGLGTLIKGIRQSDQLEVSIEPHSVSFDCKANPSPIDREAHRIHDEWKLPIYHKVVVDCYRYVLKGYFIKYNHIGCKLKLLGGEVIKLPSHALFYEPTSDEMEEFTRIEHDPHQQALEYERTLTMMRSKEGAIDPLNNPLDYRKLLRWMRGRGFLIHNIEQALLEIYGKEPALI
jgi:hypothetical protein